MSLAGIFNDIIEIYRYSSMLYSGEIAEVDIAPDPGAEALIRVTLDASQTGTIRLTGSTTETLTFDNSEYAESTSLFTVLSGVTPSGLSGAMTIETFDEAGEPVEHLDYIKSVRGYFAPKDNTQYLHAAGTRKDFNAMLFVGGDIDIRTGDTVRIDGEEEDFTVHRCVNVHGPNSESHKEIILT